MNPQLGGDEQLPAGDATGLERMADGDVLDDGRQFSAGLAGVDDACRLDQHCLHLVVSSGAVFDAPGDDEHPARTENHVSIP